MDLRPRTCADSNSPVQPNGVNPTEWLRLSSTLQGGHSLDDVLKAIAADSFQVGIHVQGFANGGSEAAILRATPVLNRQPRAARYWGSSDARPP